MQKKFDVIVGNPPYLKRGWIKFIEKSIDLADIIATINPDPLNNFSAFGNKWKQICLENGLSARKDVTSLFPNVSSGRISYFILDKNNHANPELFRDHDTLRDSITRKVISDSPQGFVIRGRQSVSGYGDQNKIIQTQDYQSNEFIHPCIMSCTNDGLVIKFASELCKYRNHSNSFQGKFVIVNRFFGKNNPDPIYEVDNIELYNLSYDCLAFKLFGNESVENFRSVYCSPLYRFVINYLRNGSFDLTQGNFMLLTRVDLSKTWTNQELYDHFGLTEEEIDYIESTVK